MPTSSPRRPIGARAHDLARAQDLARTALAAIPVIPALAATAALAAAACGPAAHAPAAPAPISNHEPPPPASPGFAITPPADGAAHWRALLAAPLAGGCVAGSPAGDALCVASSGSIQQGTTTQLVWLSPAAAPEVWPGVTTPSLSFDPAPPLDAATQARAVARLVAGHYGELPAPTWEVALDPPGDAPATGTGVGIDVADVGVTWTRKVGEHVDSGEGAWDRFHDVVASTRPAACTLGAYDIENPSTSRLRAWRIPAPGGAAVLLERTTTWAVEGDGGGDTVAQLVAPGRPCPP